MPHDVTIPRPALLLGWLGVLPFAASSLTAVVGSPGMVGPANQALVIYAVIILSFMGGAQWGLAIAASGDGQDLLLRRLSYSVVPALVAFPLAALPRRAALVGLAVAFVALLAYDVATARAGVGPKWYPALRIQLTAAVVLCLLPAAALGRA